MRATLLTAAQVATARAVLADERALLDPSIPTVTYYPDLGTWRLVHDFRTMDGDHELYIPAPFDFDLASVPRPLWSLLASHELGILAPLVHDWLYRSGGNPTHGAISPPRTYSRRDADRLFLTHMAASGVGWLRRNTAYTAVRLFGGSSWREP